MENEFGNSAKESYDIKETFLRDLMESDSPENLNALWLS